MQAAWWYRGSAISITHFIAVGEIIFMLTVVFTYMYMNFWVFSEKKILALSIEGTYS